MDYVETVQSTTGINVLEATEDEMKEKLDELGIKYDGNNRERLMDTLWKYCRKEISGPAFFVNHPKLVAPLSKEHPEDDRLTKTFQVLLASLAVKAPFFPFPGTDQLTAITTGGQLKYVRTSSYPP